MSTFLFNDIVFGPVKSRRLGVSLGINLVPVNRKICTYNCIYCECGWTSKRHLADHSFPDRFDIKRFLAEKLVELAEAGGLPDAITFAGNGEPTMHPEFRGVIEDTIELRNRLSPNSEIAVLSNCSLVQLDDVRAALMRVDRSILKLDTGIKETFLLLNQPPEFLMPEDIVQNMKMFPLNSEGTREKLIIQTLFIRGSYKGKLADNTTEREVEELLKLYGEIRPMEVQVYTIARDTPVTGLEKIPESELRRIADRIGQLGIRTSVFG